MIYLYINNTIKNVMKKNLFLLTAVLFTTVTISSQTFTTGTDINGYGTTNTFRLPYNYDHPEIDGTAFSNENYQHGEINTGEVSEVLFRFNIRKNEIEIKYNEKIYLLDKKNGYAISFNNFKYQVFKNSKGKQEFYLTSIKNKKTKLLVKEIKNVNTRVFQSSGYSDNSKNSYSKIKETYYISFDNQNAIKIPKKGKHFYKLFGEKKTKMKEFVTDNKLNRKEKKDLIKIINYYNTLL